MGDGAEDGLIEAIVDVQRRSLEAAAALVDRFVTPADLRAEGDASTSAPVPATDLVGGWAQMLKESLAAFAPASTPEGPSEPPSFEVDGHRGPVPVTVDLQGGRVGVAEVWLHNRTDVALDGLRPWCTAAVSHIGVELPSSAIRIEPVVVDLAPRSSRGLRIHVDAGEAAPGRYHSLLQVTGLPDQCLVLVADVPASAPQ